MGFMRTSSRSNAIKNTRSDDCQKVRMVHVSCLTPGNPGNFLSLAVMGHVTQSPYMIFVYCCRCRVPHGKTHLVSDSSDGGSHESRDEHSAQESQRRDEGKHECIVCRQTNLCVCCVCVRMNNTWRLRVP